MSGKLIATIYFYILSLIGVVLMVIGVFHIVNFATNLTQFEKYPLRYGGISNCEYPTDGPYMGVGSASNKPIPPNGSMMATPSAQEMQSSKEICLKNEEADRVQHRVDDMKNAIAFPIVGLIVFLIHFPQAKKRS